MAEEWWAGNTKWKRRERRNRSAALEGRKQRKEGGDERREGQVRMRRGLGTDEDTEQERKRGGGNRGGRTKREVNK